MSDGTTIHAAAQHWLDAEDVVSGLDGSAVVQDRAERLALDYDAAVTNASVAELDAAVALALAGRDGSDEGEAEWRRSDRVASLLTAERQARVEALV